MTDDQINIAIAEHLGWTDIRYIGNGYDRICIGNPPIRPGGIHVPDYCEDLNAMHSAEQKLPTDKRLDFLQWLGYCGENNTTEVFSCVNASARDRAEAYLKTVGKWKEDEQ